jgi:hypothetical protein
MTRHFSALQLLLDARAAPPPSSRCGCSAATLLDFLGVLAASDVGLEFWVGCAWATWLHDILTAWLSRRATRRDAGV